MTVRLRPTLLVQTGPGNCNFDACDAEAGTRTVWMPVFEIGGEFFHANLHSKNGGAVYTQTSIVNFTPAANYLIKDQNVYGGAFEIRRAF